MENRNTTSLVWDHWHIEVSSICALKCPRCPRAEVPENFLNKSLDLNFFKRQIGTKIIKKIKKISFCGNDGDPIYCKEFLEICEWIKQKNPNIIIVIITNGSYKKSQWWEKLGKILNANDEIHWSLDGWDQDSNQQYRINCDWSSIVDGIKSFSNVNSTTYKIWATIAFQFNEHMLDKMLETAKSMQFDLFQITKSTKFHSKYPEVYQDGDNLEPSNKNLVALGHRFERQYEQISDKQRPGDQLNNVYLQRAQNLIASSKYSGICLVGNKGVFLNSSGEFYPCCWVANRYDHNRDWHSLSQKRFNLYEKKFEQIISDSFWSTDFLKFDSFECNTKCTAEKLFDKHHVTEW